MFVFRKKFSGRISLKIETGPSLRAWANNILFGQARHPKPKVGPSTNQALGLDVFSTALTQPTKPTAQHSTRGASTTHQSRPPTDGLGFPRAEINY